MLTKHWLRAYALLLAHTRRDTGRLTSYDMGIILFPRLRWSKRFYVSCPPIVSIVGRLNIRKRFW